MCTLPMPFCRALAALALLVLGAAPARADPGALDATLQRLLADEPLAGLVYATVDRDSTRLGALGTADAASGRPLSADARVHVGSIAKTVTSLAVLRLVTMGRVDLDAPLHTLLPAVALHNPWQAGSPVRLRHLLDMTAGLGDVRLHQLFSAANTPQMALAETFAREPALLRLRSEPGRRFSYSNPSFVLAAMVIEATTGERYEAWAMRELLQPLGLRDSSFDFSTQQGPRADGRLAWGHLEAATPVAALAGAVRPAAQFTTTAADMARLMHFLLGDGRLQGRPFLRADLMAVLGRPTTTDAARAGLRSGYGLGLFTRDRHGAVGLCHGGSTVGFRAMFCVFREQRRGFFVAFNSDSESARHDRFDQALIEHLGVAAPLGTATPAPRPPADAADWNGRWVPDPGRFDSWTLLDRLAGFWTVSLDGPAPTLRPAFGTARPLHPAGGMLYRQDDRRLPTIALLRDRDDTPLLSSGHLGLRRIGGLEHAALWASVLSGAAALLWWALAPLWRRGAPGSTRWTPASLAVLAVAAAAVGLALQPWQVLGDRTAASMALAATTAALPVALCWQGWQLWDRRGTRPRSRRITVVDSLAVLAALQVCALLAGFGLWPVRSWAL